MDELSSKEKYELEREEKRREKEKSQRTCQTGRFAKQAVMAIVILGAIGFGGWLLGRSGDSNDPTAICVQHARLAMHIHPRLEIRVNGEAQEIPADIGVSPACMRPIHTHDASGTLHLEFPTVRDVALGEFFRVWEKPFRREQVTVKMFVNGVLNEEFENYIMKDGDRIEILYEELQDQPL